MPEIKYGKENSKSMSALAFHGLQFLQKKVSSSCHVIRICGLRSYNRRNIYHYTLYPVKS